MSLADLRVEGIGQLQYCPIGRGVQPLPDPILLRVLSEINKGKNFKNLESTSRTYGAAEQLVWEFLFSSPEVQWRRTGREKNGDKKRWMWNFPNKHNYDWILWPCLHTWNCYQRSKGTTYALFGLPDFAPAAGLLRGFHTSLPNPHANGFWNTPGELTSPFAGLSLVSSVTTLKWTERRKKQD